jgi:hypothetical protein
MLGAFTLPYLWYSIAKLGTQWGDLLLNVILSKVMRYLVFLSTQHDGGTTTLQPLGLGPLWFILGHFVSVLIMKAKNLVAQTFPI